MKIIYAAMAATVLAACGSNTQDSQLAGSIDDQAEQELDWIEDGEDKDLVIELAKAGQPKVYKNSYKCQGYYSDYLGRDADGQRLCLKQMAIPGDVLAELGLNNDSRFENESDYDQRMTKLYAFKHDGSLNRFLDDNDVAGLLKAFRATVSIDTEHGEYYYSDYRNNWDSNYVGDRYVPQTEAGKFINELIWDTETKVINASYEIVLYPGGGFTTDFNLVINEDYILFVKVEGWNS